MQENTKITLCEQIYNNPNKFCVTVIYYEKEDVAEKENTDNGCSKSAWLTNPNPVELMISARWIFVLKK